MTTAADESLMAEPYRKLQFNWVRRKQGESNVTPIGIISSHFNIDTTNTRREFVNEKSRDSILNVTGKVAFFLKKLSSDLKM